MVKKIFRISKIKKLEEELKNEKEKSSEYLNHLKYLKADFENYRKRIEKEIHEKSQQGEKKLILNLLTIIDEFELAITSGKKTKNKKILLEGIEMTLKKMHVTLEREGLVKIETIGKTFDPKKHEAVSKIIDEHSAEGTIIEEVRKGYMLRGQVIRPSIVKITAKENNNS